MEAQEIFQDIVSVILYGGVIMLCVVAALYLLNDLTVAQLANAIGTNRTYLSQHFAQQLAFESGYHSYSTFSSAFKQHTGKTVTAWMHDAAEQVSPSNNPHPL